MPTSFNFGIAKYLYTFEYVDLSDTLWICATSQNNEGIQSNFQSHSLIISYASTNLHYLVFFKHTLN